MQRSKKEINNPQLLKLKQNFEEAMDDDFNTSKALGCIHELITEANTVVSKIAPSKETQKENIEFLKEAEVLFSQLTQVLGLKIEAHISSDEFSSLIAEREKARKSKDWVAADKIRNELKQKGITIEDTPFGPRLIVK